MQKNREVDTRVLRKANLPFEIIWHACYFQKNGAWTYSEQSSLILAELSWPSPSEPTIRRKLPQARGVYLLVGALSDCQRNVNKTFPVFAKQCTEKYSLSFLDRCESDKFFSEEAILLYDV